MKRMILLLSAILCITSVSGCAETPDEVKTDMSSYREEKDSSSDNFEFTYINVVDLSENAKTALNKEYGQFKNSDKIRFEQPSKLNIMSFEKITGFIENADTAIGLFFDESELDKNKLETTNDEDEESIMINDEDDRVYFYVSSDGFIALLKPDAFEISYSYQEPNVKIYHPDRNDDLSDEYQLKDGKCSVGDAVEYIENWFEANYKPLAPYYDYSVESVIVREHEGNYLYQISIQALYNRVPVDSYTRKQKIVNGEPTMEMAYWDYRVDIQMISINEIASFTNGGGIYKPAEIEKIDKCISMESVLELCKRTFTDFKDVTFSDIDIMYTLEPVYEYDNENIPHVVSYDSRPVWEIVIDVPPEDFLAAGEINTYGDTRKYIYVDMITGEIEYDLDINPYHN